MIHKVEQSLQQKQGHKRKSPLLRERLFYEGCRAWKRLQGAYTALGTTLLIFDEYLTTTKYNLDGSLQVPYWDCPKGEKVHWGMDKALPPPCLNTLSQGTTYQPLSDNWSSPAQLLPFAHFHLLFAIINLIWECFRNITQTSSRSSKRDW